MVKYQAHKQIKETIPSKFDLSYNNVGSL